jgi:fucose permease
MAIVLLSINSTDLFISPLAVVLECGIERKAALAIYACVATTLALLPLYALNDTLVLPLVVAILGAGTGAILFQPAFAAAVESLTQRREVTGTRYQTS